MIANIRCDDRQLQQAELMKAIWEGLEPFPPPRELPEHEARLYGPLLASRVVFFEQANAIFDATGVDLYAGQSSHDLAGLPQFDWKIKIKQKTILHRRRNAPKGGGVWQDVEIPSASGKSVCRFQLRMLEGAVVEIRAALDVPHQFVAPVSQRLTDEQQTQLQKRRAARARAGKDTSTRTPRFGFCKTEKCGNRKHRRLLVNSLCPICRGASYSANPDGTVAATITGNVRLSRAAERKMSKRPAFPS
jgi:hypothetical protein